MLNPKPRFSFLKTRDPLVDAIEASAIQPTIKELVESVKTPEVLNRAEERMVNNLVTRVLEAAQKIEISDVYEIDQSTGLKIPERVIAKPQLSSTFRLPPADESGLYNKAITLDESQSLAVKELATQQYGCLIGAAGTGKTTVQKYLLQELFYGDHGIDVKFLDATQGLNVALVAFTGMAVQVIKSNLPDWMQPCAKTIHSLLQFAPEEMISTKTGKPTRLFVPQRNNIMKLDHDVIIIDEASMLGLDLWKQLLDALKPGCRVYMTGDLNQLPPIIGQPIFAFALSKWHVCELTKVHRQKEAGANRIVEVAHEVLNGKMPTFDSTKGNPYWRVIGHQVDPDPKKAQQQILAVLNQLRTRRVDIEVDPAMPLIYDPYRDRVMTAGNGFDENQSSSLVQQAPLNESLSMLIQPQDAEHPRFIIDAGRNRKRFAINLRVMATKNESPDKVGRVTNGMTGIITSIVRNAEYAGDAKMFGIEAEVEAESRYRIQHLRLDGVAGISNRMTDEVRAKLDGYSFDDAETDSLQASEDASEGGGFASHSVEVVFDNGSVRKYVNKAGVDSLSLAYCSTVAKCQGSQFDTAVIICHHTQKGQLSREWLYTAITRATKRVVILYTDYGLRSSISKQRIHGKNLAEKIERYRQMADEGVKAAGLGPRVKINVPLYIETYESDTPDYEYGR